MYKTFPLTTHDQDQISALIFHTSPEIIISWYYPLTFYYQNPFDGSGPLAFRYHPNSHLIFQPSHLVLLIYYVMERYYCMTWFLFGILQQNYWLQTQVKNLIVQSLFKALISSKVVNFIPKTTNTGIGQSLTLTGYSIGLT